MVFERLLIYLKSAACTAWDPPIVNQRREGSDNMTDDAIYCFDRASVLFAIYPQRLRNFRLVCEISEDALRDIFGARGGSESLVEACKSHRDLIQAAASRRYHQDSSRPVKLESCDFAFPAVFVADGV